MTQPLWRVMRDAYAQSAPPDPDQPWTTKYGYAAELRAIARQIAERDPGGSMSALAVEEWLYAEAARAEAGE